LIPGCNSGDLGFVRQGFSGCLRTSLILPVSQSRKEPVCSEADEVAALEWWREMRRRRHEHDGAVAWYDECAPQQGPSQYWGRI